MSIKFKVSIVRGIVQHRMVQPVAGLFSEGVAAGICLLVATLVALVWANSRFSPVYVQLWRTPLGFAGAHGHAANLHFIVNDVLMAVFFFVVGMEIKREILVGELSATRRAILPVVAAIGGALVPALLYRYLNAGGEGRDGWGIPMATDIAFAVGILALFGRRVPAGIKVFLTALAIADDLLAVVVIALFYTHEIDWPSIGNATVCLVLLVAANRLGSRRMPVYLVLGGALWFFTLRSGVHSTVAGVAVAMAIPGRRDNDLLYRLERRLQPWVTFGIMPLFALANAGLVVRGNLAAALGQQVVLGIWVGLLLGKPIGITGASYAAVKMGWAALPENVRWRDLYAASWLGGIGFTMSLFIAGLAFPSDELFGLARLGIFVGSLTAGTVGCMLVSLTRRTQEFL